MAHCAQSIAQAIVLTGFYSSALSIGGPYIHTHPPTKSCKAEKAGLVLQTALTDFITLLNGELSKY